MESVGKFEFSRKDLIGHGAFAVVFKGRHKEELKHENIVRLLDYQYCNGGDLAEYLHSKGTLSEDTIRVFLQQIAQAMKVLQSKGILHRDLKPQNILLCHTEGRRSSPINTCIKIGSSLYFSRPPADFGFARHLQTNTMAATLCGSPMYMAPEVIMSQNYDAKADLWSIGTIVYQCLTGKAPFHHSDGEMHRLQPKVPCSPTQDTPGFLLKEIANRDSRNTSSYTEDYVMVPAQFLSEYTCEAEGGSPIESCLIYSGTSLLAERGPGAADRMPPPSPLLHCPSKLASKPVEFGGSNRSRSEPIPVPTQIQNYQRMVQPVGLHGSTRVTLCCAGSSNESSPQCGGCRSPASGFNPYSSRLATGGARPQQSSPLVGTTPKTPEQSLPLCTRTGRFAVSPDMQDTFIPKVHSRMPSRIRTVPDLQSLDLSPATQTDLSRKSANKIGPAKRSLSTGRLSDMLLKAAFGAQLLDEGSDDSLGYDKSMDTTDVQGYVGFIFFLNAGSPSYINSAWLLNSRLLQRGSRRNSETEAMDATPHCNLVFHPPELPEDTLMELYLFNSSQQAHTDALSDLRFTLAFVHCVMELASSKGPGLDTISSPDVSLLEQSLVTDQISLLSREWSYAEQLVLYMKAEEFLSAALHSAKGNIKQGRVLPSATVKQVIKKLNELYKTCVTCCRSLTNRLQSFLLDKQKLMDRFNGLTAEKLIYNYTVHMVQSAALDEMFHYGTASVQRYHKALLLMEGLSRVITEQKDIDSIDKCKQCIERRLSALQT
eukprot:superscaffoldBa00000947_g8135